MTPEQRRVAAAIKVAVNARMARRRGEMDQAQLREAQENASRAQRISKRQAAAKAADRRTAGAMAGRGRRAI